MRLFRRLAQQGSGPLSFLANSAGALIFTDSIFAYQSLLGTYESGSLLNLGWVLIALLSMVAGALQASTVQSEPTTRPLFPPAGSQGNGGFWPIYLPYAWLIGASSW